MRRLLSETNLTIDAPNALHQVGDNAFYLIVAKNYSGALTCTLTIGGKTYAASSANGVVRYDIRDYVSAVTDVSVTLEYSVVTMGQSYQGTITDTFKVLQGRTLLSRHRCSESVICVPEGVSTIDLYAPAACEVRSLFDTNEVHTKTVSHEGICSIDVSDCNKIIIGSSSKITYGELWNEVSTNARTINLVDSCVDFNKIVLQYVNADGCTRYAVGKVLGISSNAERNGLTSNDGDVHNLPASVVSSVGQTVTIGFDCVKPGQYLGDIVMCDSVAIVGSSVILVPSTNSIDNSYTQEDITIDFNIQ